MIYNKKLVLLCFIFSFFSSCKESDKKNATVSQPAPVDEGIVILPTEPGTTDSFAKSIKAFVKSKIGPAELTVSYYSPAVRGRIIWGGLVPYGRVWVTGAHNATSLETNTELLIGDNKLPAGKYALFTIPGEKEWAFIVNKNWQQHLADNYREAEDIFRMRVKPASLTAKQERLMYQVISTGENTGNLEMHWENIKIVVPVKMITDK